MSDSQWLPLYPLVPTTNQLVWVYTIDKEMFLTLTEVNTQDETVNFKLVPENVNQNRQSIWISDTFITHWQPVQKPLATPEQEALKNQERVQNEMLSSIADKEENLYLPLDTPKIHFLNALLTAHFNSLSQRTQYGSFTQENMNHG